MPLVTELLMLVNDTSSGSLRLKELNF